MKCDLPGLYVQPRGGVKGLRDGKKIRQMLYNVHKPSILLEQLKHTAGGVINLKTGTVLERCEGSLKCRTKPKYQ